MSSTTNGLAGHDESADSPKTASATTARTSAVSYRMLYRGSLALPDSEILLDGIIFVMQIARNSPMSLINSPIPLGLESMRGRSLRLISTLSIKDTHIECFGDVAMYIHPHAFLTRSFFERTLCTDYVNAPLLPDPNFTHLRTSMAVRIGLGDGTGPEETDILIFGQLPTPAPTLSLPSPSPNSGPRPPPTLQLLAGRIAPPPTPQPQRKLTRPDDPHPRPHPLENLLRLSPGRRGIKRKRSSNDPFGPPLHHPTPHMDGPISPANASENEGGSGSALLAALAQAQAQDERRKKQGRVVVDAPRAKGLLKRPTLSLLHHHHRTGDAPSPSSPSPSTANLSPTSASTPISRGQSVDRDGFLVPDVPVRILGVKREKEKGKSPLRTGTDGETPGTGKAESELEEKNKTAIKKRMLTALEACGISKQHPQFRDMYGWIHRGVAFAVRGVIQDTKVDRDLLTKLIEVHLEMYMGGRGGRYQSHAQSTVHSSGDSHTTVGTKSPSQATPDTNEPTTLPHSIDGSSPDRQEIVFSRESRDKNDPETDPTRGGPSLESTSPDTPTSAVRSHNPFSPGGSIE